MGTIFRDIYNYAITKDGTAYFLNADILVNNGFDYTNTIYTNYSSYTVEESFPISKNTYLKTQGHFLPVLGKKDFVELLNNNFTHSMQAFLDESNFENIEFDKVVSFYFKSFGFKLIESFCNTITKDGLVINDKITVENLDLDDFIYSDYAEYYMREHMDVKQII